MRGWGVPMATDIAFALGVLALLGDRVSLGLKVFLLALAIVDDLGAVLVIALFYSENISIGALLLSFLAWAGALAYGRFGGGKAAGVRPDRPGDVVFHAEVGRARDDRRRADGPGGAAAPPAEPAAAATGAAPAHDPRRRLRAGRGR